MVDDASNSSQDLSALLCDVIVRIYFLVHVYLKHGFVLLLISCFLSACDM